MEWSNGIIGSAEDAADMRRRMGAAALEMDASDGSGQTRWRAIVAARLPGQHWPQQPVLITAVDAHTGEPVVFDVHSGIDLVDAVAASTSNGYRIGENRYTTEAIDAARTRPWRLDTGGCWCCHLSAADRGCRRSGHGYRNPGRGTARGGCRVETVFPDGGAGDVFDANALDPSTRPQAARGGYARGRALAELVAESWRCRPKPVDSASNDGTRSFPRLSPRLRTI